MALLPDWAPMWHVGYGSVPVPLPARAPVRRVGVVWATHGPRAALSEALLTEAQAMYRQPN